VGAVTVVVVPVVVVPVVVVGVGAGCTGHATVVGAVVVVTDGDTTAPLVRLTGQIRVDGHGGDGHGHRGSGTGAGIGAW
jgi:hypothetical protein